MPEATERLDETTRDPIDPPDGQGPGGGGRGRGPFRPFRGRAVLAVVLVLIAAVVVSWASGHRSTTGRAEPFGNAANSAGLTPTGGPSGGPAIPAQLTAVAADNAVQLNWHPDTGPDTVTRYVLFRDGKKVATVAGATGYRDTGAQPGHSYFYQVQAVDSAGVGSPLSPKVTVALPGSAVGSSSANSLPPMPASWPSATSTGASGSLTAVSGDITLGTTGQVYQNMRVKGTIVVTACNVTIRNVEVDTGEPYTGDNTPDLFAIWLQESATCGVTIDHVSTITDAAPDVYVTTSIRDARGGPVRITNSKLVGAQLGILGVSSGAVGGNFIQLGHNMRGDHNDAIQADGSSGLTISHNTLLNPNDQTSALALYTEYGNNSDDMVSGNLMAGGGYTCYCGDGATDNAGNPARAVNVSFVNNVFWRLYYPDAGGFGAARAYNPAGGGRWANNVFMNADGTLTTQQVPQPAPDGQ